MPEPPSSRVTIKRKPQRGAYDRASIDSILDEALICHIGFSTGGNTFVLPTIHVRVGDRVYLHGSPASRLLHALASGAEACLTVTLVDGLVLARSAMHHSMNYRSVVLLGRASVVEDGAEKLAVLKALTEHIVPGRWADVRVPTEQELRQTLVLAIPINEASAKVRTGPPLDDESDYDLPTWAGVIPLRLTADQPVPDPKLPPEIESPGYAMDYLGSRHSTQTEANKTIVRRYYDELWNSWNMAAAEELIAADISFRGSLGVAVRGRADFVGYIRLVRSAFPDFNNRIDELVAEGEKVVARLTYSGTHRGELYGIRATGRSITYSGTAIFRVSEGQIAEGWVLGDTDGLKRQLES